MKFKEINEEKVVKVLSTVSLLLTNLMIVSIFLNYYSIKSNLTNPLIPEGLLSYAYEPHIKRGLALSVGLLVFMILKSLRQNLLVIILFVILIIANQFIY